jgi:3D (Asp-Asp-Asp) domain-containing protein
MTSLADDRSAPVVDHSAPPFGGAARRAARDRVLDAARYLADLIARIVRGAAVGLVVLAGCSEAAEESTPSAPPAQATAARGKPAKAAVAVRTADEGPKDLGFFTITFYYMIGEEEVAPRVAANDNARGSGDEELASIAPDMVTLYSSVDKECTPIAEVTREFAQQLALQGSGKLRDGRVLNIWGHCRCDREHRLPCFRVTKNQWGTAGSGHPLQPFRTVAVDPKVVKLGSLLYVPLLEGRTMPGRAPWGGFVHDGCVVADDTGGFGGAKLDLFVGKKGYFFGLGVSGSQTGHAWAKHVPVYDGSKICERRGTRVARTSGAI